FFQEEDGIRDFHVTGVQTCALPIFTPLSDLNIKETPLYYEPFVAYVSPTSGMYAQDLLSPKDMDLSEIWLLNEGHCMQSQVINRSEERRVEIVSGRWSAA